MKRLALMSALLVATNAYANDASVLSCNVTVISTKNGEAIAASAPQPGAMVTDSGHSFYAVVEDRVYVSPQLSTRNGLLYGFGKDGQTFIKKDSMYSVSDNDTNIIFDDCDEVVYG